MDEELLYTAALAGSLKLSAHGEWLHEGRPIGHPRIREYLFRHIEWHEPSRQYRLRFGKGAATFTCEDTAFFVADFRDDGSRIILTLSDGSEETLVIDSLTIGAAEQIYCTVKNGHRARFLRGAHQYLLTHAVSDTELQLSGRTVRIRRTSK